MTNTMTPTNRPAATQLCDIIVRKDATIVALTKQLKIATEALNSAAGVLSGEEMTKGSLIRALEQVNKALARIKEV